MSDLAAQRCVPCRGGVPPLTASEIAPLKGQLDPGWDVAEDHRLRRAFRFPNFRTALDFAVAVGEMAEEQDHHPDLHVAWGRVVVEIWTHKIDGLTKSDFVFAAKTDRIHGGFEA